MPRPRPSLPPRIERRREPADPQPGGLQGPPAPHRSPRLAKPLRTAGERTSGRHDAHVPLPVGDPAAIATSASATTIAARPIRRFRPNADACQPVVELGLRFAISVEVPTLNPASRGEQCTGSTIPSKLTTDVSHNNSACTVGDNIESYNTVSGTGGNRLCDQCKSLNAQWK